jgi:2-alkenal reductase
MVIVNIEIVSRAHIEFEDVPEGIIDSSGSGFVLDLDGNIVTNSHVVRDAEEILVTFFDGYVAEAELVGMDDYSDLAVIHVDPGQATLVPVELGDSNELKVGQRIVAIGNPFGLDGSMTVGIVSAVGRSLPSAQLLDPTTYDPYDNPSIIQIDAAVNPGNSGGPLLDSYGRVVGVNTAIRTETGTFEGIAFAVPVNTLKRVVPQLIESGQAEYSYLGITSTGGVSMAMVASELNLPVSNGVLITDVRAGSPAERAGLQSGTQTTVVRGVEVPTDSDIIVAINGTLVRDIDDLVAYLVENTSPGDTVVLTIVRGGNTLDLDVTLDRRPANN